jgi:two-component system, NarL family, sensor kinase
MNKQLCIFCAYLLIACSMALNASAQQSQRSYNPQANFQSLYRQGYAAETRGNFSLALDCYKKAATIAEAGKLYDDTYRVHTSMLNIYYYQADYLNAMNIAQKGLLLAERYHDQQDKSHYINQVGFIYLKQENAGESIRYFAQYLTLANEIPNRMMIADACNSMADSYLLKKDYKTSLNYSFKALAVYDKLHSDTGETIDRNRRVFKNDRVASTLLKISTAYKLQGDYKQALRYAVMILDLYNKNRAKFNKYEVASYYINTGNIYSELKDYNRANTMLGAGLSIARSILHREDMRDAYEGLSKNFASQKRYDSAYYYHLLFTGLKDSILNEKTSREINSLEVAQRDKEIALLNQQQKLKETETERHNVTRDFIIGFITLVAVIAFLLLYIQNSMNRQRLVAEKQTALQIERQRISSDMHDDIGTGLSTMLLYINMLKLRSADNEDKHNIDRIAVLGTALVEQMKEIVWSLSPGNDRLDSLLLYIRQYFVLLFEPLDYDVNVIFPSTIPEIELKSDMRRNVFLCVKEALNNIIKHAKATAAELNVQVGRHKLTITIKDNGCGLPLPLAENITGNGLKNIKRRVDSLKGKFNLINDKGAVMTLEFELPWYPKG